MHIPDTDREMAIRELPIRREVREFLLRGPTIDSFRCYFSSQDRFYSQRGPETPGNWPVFAGRVLLPLWERHEKLFALDISSGGGVIAFHAECPEEYERLENIDVALVETIRFHVIECGAGVEEALEFARSVALPHLDCLGEALRGPVELMSERFENYRQIVAMRGGEILSRFDDKPSETPFDPEQGLWFKGGSLYRDRDLQISTFQEHYGVILPRDFLSMIGEYAEGSFDGWYRVKEGSFGRIVWSHLLLMRLPTAADDEWDSKTSVRGHTRIATKVLERNRAMFYSAAGDLAYFPFGHAYCLRKDKSGADGYLAFAVQERSRVIYISQEAPENVPVAESFSAMMANAVFEFYG